MFPFIILYRKVVAEIERLGSILQKLHGQMAGKFNEVCVCLFIMSLLHSSVPSVISSVNHPLCYDCSLMCLLFCRMKREFGNYNVPSRISEERYACFVTSWCYCIHVCTVCVHAHIHTYTYTHTHIDKAIQCVYLGQIQNTITPSPDNDTIH